MRSPIILALLAMLVATGAAAQTDPSPPTLPRGADPNDWEAYYDRGTQLLATVPAEGDAYLLWARRLAPERAEPLYAHWIALHLRDVRRWQAWMRDDQRVLRSPEIIRMDSLLMRAQVRNPFLHRGLMVLLYQATPGSWRRDLYTRAMLDYSTGKLGEAVRQMDNYVSHHPRNLSARWSLALALVSSGKLDSAQVTMDTLLARLRQGDEQRVVRVYESKEMQEYAAGLLALARHRPAEAREYMERALVENAGAWFAHAGRARALLAAGHADEASQEMAAALEFAPQDAIFHFDYGSALFAAGHPAEAAGQFRRAVKMEPYWADAWAALGDAERGAGHAAEAADAYERFIGLAPRHAAASIETARRQVAALRSAPAAP